MTTNSKTQTQGQTAVEVLSPQTIAQTRQSAITVSSTVLSSAAQLRVTDADTYAIADRFLSRIRSARKTVADKLAVILDPINTARNAVLALRHELDDPLAEAETSVKQRMATWQAADRERIAREQAARLEEERRLQREAQQKLDEEVKARRAAELAELQVAQAKTAEARRKAEAEAVERRQIALEAEQAARQAEVTVIAAEIEHATNAPTPTRAAGSTVREVRRWRVADLGKLIAAVAAGDVPDTVLTLDTSVMETYWRADQGMVEGWPGVEVWVDTQIAGRGGR